MVKSRLLVDIETNVSMFKRRVRYWVAKAIRNYCPTNLRNFDKKYEALGKLKKDSLRMLELIFVKTVMVLVVIPVIAIFTLIEAIKYLFRKGK